MSYSMMSKKAKNKVRLQAKRQRAKNSIEFREDNSAMTLGMSIKALYTDLNQQLFEGQLPSITVTYNSRLRRVLGKAFFRVDTGGVLVPTSIEIRKNHRWTPRFKRKVMTHEMCHIWAYHFHNESGHGKKFWGKMKELGYPKYHDWSDSQQWERDVYC